MNFRKPSFTATSIGPDHDNTKKIEAGEFFGEVAALSRTPYMASYVADGEAEVLEIRWAGFRDLCCYSNALKALIETQYSMHSIQHHLGTHPIFEHLKDSEKSQIESHIRFETFGDFDRYSLRKTAPSFGEKQSLTHEPVIIEQDDYFNGLHLIHSGFVRIIQSLGDTDRTVGYLGPKDTYGFKEMCEGQARSSTYHYSLRALPFAEVVFIPTIIMQDMILPGMPAEERSRLLSRGDVPLERKNGKPSTRMGNGNMVEWLVEERFFQGTAAMQIDLEKCSRCDDCLVACSVTHNQDPLFIRQGMKFGKYMVANSCMHCVNPVCLIGCPTGAIQRNATDGSVAINQASCIGCTTCATSCPYSNIKMVNWRDENGNLMLDEESHAPLLKAAKCDLCFDQPNGPACQNACPQQALTRVDLSNLDSLHTQDHHA